MTLTVEQSVDIAAPASTVWRVLSDTDSYGRWNPFIQSLSGRLEPGARVTARICLPGRPPWYSGLGFWWRHQTASCDGWDA